MIDKEAYKTFLKENIRLIKRTNKRINYQRIFKDLRRVALNVIEQYMGEVEIDLYRQRNEGEPNGLCKPELPDEEGI